MKSNSRKIRSQKKSKWSSVKDLGFFDPNAGKKPAKVRITVFIDSNVLLDLKRQASLEGEGYQTLLNRVLRQHIQESEKSNTSADVMSLIQGQAEIISMLKQVATKQDALLTEERSSTSSSRLIYTGQFPEGNQVSEISDATINMPRH